MIRSRTYCVRLRAKHAQPFAMPTSETFLRSSQTTIVPELRPPESCCCSSSAWVAGCWALDRATNRTSRLLCRPRSRMESRPKNRASILSLTKRAEKWRPRHRRFLRSPTSKFANNKSWKRPQSASHLSTQPLARPSLRRQTPLAASRSFQFSRQLRCGMPTSRCCCSTKPVAMSRATSSSTPAPSKSSASYRLCPAISRMSFGIRPTPTWW